MREVDNCKPFNSSRVLSGSNRAKATTPNRERDKTDLSIESSCSIVVPLLRRVLTQSVKIINSVYGVGLKCPALNGKCDDQFPIAKKFVGGLLDALNGNGTHEWIGNPEFERLGQKERWTVAASLFSIRKRFPTACKSCSFDDYKSHRNRLTVPIKPSRSYLRYVRKSVNAMFRPGWDSGWEEKIKTASPSLSACREASRAEGGNFAVKGSLSSFKKECNNKEVIDNLIVYKGVPAGGKCRGITIASKEHGVLRPLHSMLYDHISRYPWLLRGDVTLNKLRTAFPSAEDGFFISGDYECSTDYLSVEVAETILKSVFSNCRFVPRANRKAAFSSLRPSVIYPDKVVCPLQRGQMMGSLLCFPLLCIQNYIAFKYFVPESVPVLINGDDILWRGTERQYQRWVSGVAKVGLVLSHAKTTKHNRFLQINSTYFWFNKKFTKLPVIRFGLFSPQPGPMSLAAGQRKLLNGFPPGLRENVEVAYLQQHYVTIKKSHRSCRFLGIRSGPRALFRAGLGLRESWYNQVSVSQQQSNECELSLPSWNPSYHNKLGKIPNGYIKRNLPRYLRRYFQREMGYLMVKEKWKKKFYYIPRGWDLWLSDVMYTSFEHAWRLFRSLGRSDESGGRRRRLKFSLDVMTISKLRKQAVRLLNSRTFSGRNRSSFAPADLKLSIRFVEERT